MSNPYGYIQIMDEIAFVKKGSTAICIIVYNNAKIIILQNNYVIKMKSMKDIKF